MTMPRDTVGIARQRGCTDTCAMDAVPAKVAVRFVAADDLVAGMLPEQRVPA